MIIHLARSPKDKVDLTVAKDESPGYIFLVHKSNRSGIITFTPSEPVGHYALRWDAMAALWARARQLSERGYKSNDYTQEEILEHYFEAMTMATKQDGAARGGKRGRICVKAREPRKCVICGETFMPMSWSNKYCPTCRATHAHRKETKDDAPKFCKICGKELQPQKRAYCSEECAHEGKLEFNRQAAEKRKALKEAKAEARFKLKSKPKVKHCAVCGALLTGKEKKYCKECKKAVTKKLMHERYLRVNGKEDTPKYCKICGKEVHWPHFNYCSDECALEGRREVKRRQNARRKEARNISRVDHCIICGKALTEGQKLYCSPECRKAKNQERNKHRKELRRERRIESQKEKRCPVCGKELPLRSTVYCSAECRNQASAEKGRKRREEIRLHGKQIKHCLICGKELPKGKAKYCSKECAHEGTNRARRERKAP